ncbi:putative porin [Novosphingobium sp.]|uniref:putative porin n=1 Tax=Novosphingobium sp. TaxID=1874826 RepID=UPI003D0E1D25
MSPIWTRKAALLLCTPAALLLGVAPAHAQAGAGTPARVAEAPSTNAMVNLVRLLVAQGTISRTNGDALIAQATQEADLALAAQADAHRAFALVAPQGSLTGTPAASGAALAMIDRPGSSAPAPAEGSATLPPPAAGTIRVPYVPQVVRDQIRDDLRADIMHQARVEGWASPGMSVPEWVKGLHIHGDLRLRSQSDVYSRFNATDVPNFQAIVNSGPLDLLSGAIPFENAVENKYNLLGVRVRLGFDFGVSSSTKIGVELASGNNNAPTSTSATLGNGFYKRNVYLNKAYIEQRLTSNAVITAGRMDNPFLSTDALFNTELKFDGIAAQVSFPHRVFGYADFTLRGGAFPLDFGDQNFPDTATLKQQNHQKWLFAGQILGEVHLGGEANLKLAAGYYFYRNTQGRPSAPCALGFGDTQCSTDWSAPFYVQSGNTLFQIRDIVNSAGQSVDGNQLLGLAEKFHVLNAMAVLKVPVSDKTQFTLLGEYLRNLAFTRNVCGHGEAYEPVNNGGAGGSGNICDPVAAKRTPFVGGGQGFQVLASIGYPAPRQWGEWRAFLGYKYLQSDVVLDAFNDDSFHLGGTNAKGFTLGGSLGLSQGVTGTARWISTNQVSGVPLAIDVFQFDLNVAF